MRKYPETTACRYIGLPAARQGFCVVQRCQRRLWGIGSVVASGVSLYVAISIRVHQNEECPQSIPSKRDDIQGTDTTTAAALRVNPGA